MNLRFQMLDIDTGELLAHTDCNYVCNFNDKKDIGFRKVLAWAQSCVRGVRLKKHKRIALIVGFTDDIKPDFQQLTIDGIEIF